MIQLMIKGGVADAEKALTSRIFEPVSPYRVHRDCVLVMVRDSDWKAVTDWFGEPGQAPYPPGSLLHYQLDCRDNR